MFRAGLEDILGGSTGTAVFLSEFVGLMSLGEEETKLGDLEGKCGDLEGKFGDLEAAEGFCPEVFGDGSSFSDSSCMTGVSILSRARMLNRLGGVAILANGTLASLYRSNGVEVLKSLPKFPASGVGVVFPTSGVPRLVPDTKLPPGPP